MCTLSGALPRLNLASATLWLLGWTVLAAAGSCGLWLSRSWKQATLYSACFLLNGMLSADNLVVFMLLLQQSNLNEAHHVAAVCDGMSLALCMRIILSLAGAALLDRFSWLLLIFAALLMATGIKMLCFDDSGGGGSSSSKVGEAKSGTADSDGNGGELAQRVIGACVPLLWSDSTGSAYWVRDHAGQLCATRMAVSVVGICISDVLFAMDSVPVVLSLTTSPFLLVASQAVSLLWLRPVYFLLAAIAHHLESMQQMLAVVLILIASRTFLEAAGHEVPIQIFLLIVAGWRVVAVVAQLVRAHIRKRHAVAACRAARQDLTDASE